MPDNEGLIVMTRWGGNADADVLSFFSRTGLSDGTQRAAVATLVLGLKSAGLWSMLYALYPFVGGSAASHAENLKSSSYQITWTNSPTHNANGVTFNGSTNYGICAGLTGNSVVPHLSGQTVYVRTTNASSTGVQNKYCGMYDAGSTILYFIEYVDNGGLERSRACAGAVAGLSNDGTPPIAQKRGLLSVNRTSTSSMKCYHNGSEIMSYGSADSSTPPSFDYWVGGANAAGALANPCNENLALYAVHAGMTLAQVGTFTTLIAAFQTALGRNV